MLESPHQTVADRREIHRHGELADQQLAADSPAGERFTAAPASRVGARFEREARGIDVRARGGSRQALEHMPIVHGGEARLMAVGRKFPLEPLEPRHDLSSRRRLLRCLWRTPMRKTTQP